MIFLIHPGNPEWQEPETHSAEDLSEAIEVLFPSETEDAVMIWGNQSLSVSYKYDMSVIAEDVILMLECLRRTDRGEERIFFSSDTFNSEWLIKWNDKQLLIDPVWNSAAGNKQSALNDLGVTEVSLSHFIEQWTAVLEKIYEAVLMSGMTLEDSENFEALASVLRNTEEVTAAV